VVQSLLPDIVLMDVELPVLNGLRAAAEITAANPDIRLIMLSLYGNTSFIREAFQNGAKAYLLKTELLTALPTVLETVAKGNIYAPEVEA
jgi:DNA-binding NarL/FixJ family response regulator